MLQALLVVRSDDVSALNVSGIVFRRNNAGLVADIRIFVHDLVLKMYVRSDLGVCTDIASLDHCTGGDVDTADDGILNASVDLSAV